MRADQLLATRGMPAEIECEQSQKRFPDGADFRIEIPSVEGPAVLAAVVREGEKRGVTVNRVSQGSGAMVLSQNELREMSRIARDAGLEVSLFVGPREEWGLGVHTRVEGALNGGLRGIRQLRYGLEDVLRAIDCGIRGFLVADIGLLQILADLQLEGEVPPDVVWKASVLVAPSNPATFSLLERLGADTVNVPTDLSLIELQEMRAVSNLPLDLYVESPDSMGGVVRGEQLVDLIGVSAPLYAKFGLRNSRNLYPSGLHLEQEAIVIAQEKVRRAQIAMEWMDRLESRAVQSEPNAAGAGIPASV